MKDKLARLLRGPIRIYNEFLIRKLYSKQRDLQLLEEKDSTLILVPHIDDETIGLGAYLLQSSRYHCLCYITDSGGSLSEKEYDETSKERILEAEEVMRILGINDVRYLNIKEDQLKENSIAEIDKLREVLEIKKWERIFTVSPYDAHPIHRQSTGLLFQLAESVSDRCRITFYEVSNLLPTEWENAYIPIDKKTYKEKEKIYKIFKSQKETMDFDIFQRLNRNKGKALRNSIYAAEYFSDFSKKEFITKMKEIINMDLPNHRIGNHRSFRKTL